jgi:hypothetical protein
MHMTSYVSLITGMLRSDTTLLFQNAKHINAVNVIAHQIKTLEYAITHGMPYCQMNINNV